MQPSSVLLAQRHSLASLRTANRTVVATVTAFPSAGAPRCLKAPRPHPNEPSPRQQGNWKAAGSHGCALGRHATIDTKCGLCSPWLESATVYCIDESSLSTSICTQALPAGSALRLLDGARPACEGV